MAKTPIPASAKGATSEARMPMSENSNGPRIPKHRQPFSAFVPLGTRASGQRRDSSSFVRVTERKEVEVVQAGIGPSASNLQIAMQSGRTVSESRCEIMNTPHDK